MPTVNEYFVKYVYFILKHILRRKGITLEKVKAILLLGGLEKNMLSAQYFEKPLADLDYYFVADIKRTINNARVFLRHRDFTFEGWLMWISDIRIHSFITHHEVISQYANAILFIMMPEDALKEIYRRHLQNPTMYAKRVAAVLRSFKDDSGWDEDIIRVSETSADSAIEAIAKI